MPFVSRKQVGTLVVKCCVSRKYISFILEVKNLGPWAKGLLKGMPAAAAGLAAMAPVAKYPLVLAEDRTRRPDVLRHLKMYEGGWNVTNKHYWAVCVVV
jgi:hypothetical protein